MNTIEHDEELAAIVAEVCGIAGCHRCGRRLVTSEIVTLFDRFGRRATCRPCYFRLLRERDNA